MRGAILTGGYGTRLLPLTENVAKAMLPVAGKPILQCLLENFPLDTTPIISTNKRFEPELKKFVRDKKIKIKAVVEDSRMEEQKLGSVGAIQYLVEKEKIDEPLLLIAGDNLLELDLSKFVKAYRGNLMIAVYDIGDIEKVRNRYGSVILGPDNAIVDFEEKPAQPKTTLVSTGVYIFPPDTLKMLPEFLASENKKKDAMGYFCKYLLKTKNIKADAYIFSEHWFDIGSRGAYIEANQHYAKADSYYGKDVKIENSKVSSSVLLGNTTVTDSELEGCAVDEDCLISGVKLRNCVIGKGTKIKSAP
ncbi:MAG: sugar phosphate nucleotidyltransferase [Candidatus Wallbacteria bacterium]|nr:sugar phosphate nucleotidyltransferase [Candidatus Wallbacteria bacterium]